MRFPDQRPAEIADRRGSTPVNPRLIALGLWHPWALVARGVGAATRVVARSEADEERVRPEPRARASRGL
jgi:hypothetical protein